MEKFCESCGVLFGKPVNCSLKSWETRKFCSRKCSDTNTLFKKGVEPWNKQKDHLKGDKHPMWKGGQDKKLCQICKKSFQVDKYRSKTAKYCSVECLNKFRSSKEWRKHLSKRQKERVKQGLHNAYRGGVTEENKIIRRSLKFKLWREAVFERDNYTCQICGERGGVLHPDHIKQFAYYPELRFDINNGRTLCEECHRQTPTWGRRKEIIINR